MAIITGENDCGIRFLCENYISNANLTLDTGVANAQFPLDNLKNPATMKYFRSESNSAVIVIDLQQVANIDTFAIIGNTNRTFGISAASIKTAPSTDFTLATSYPIPLSPEQNMGYIFLETPVAHRYVELTLTGTGSYIELGRFLVGEHLYLPQNNLDLNSFSYGYTDRSRVSQNLYGQRFVDERPMTKQLSGSIKYCTKDEMDSLDDLFMRFGIHEPFFMVTDIGGNSFIDSEYKGSIYGYLTRMPKWSADGGHLYTTSIELDEVV